jgi:uncharacterized membrane protein (DUF2068 family)
MGSRLRGGNAHPTSQGDRLNAKPGTASVAARFDGMRIVALFKFGKALLLMATAYGATKLLDPSIALRLTQWSETINDRFARLWMLKALAWVGSLSKGTVDGVVLVTVGYIALVLVEGTGLWLHKRWAEWLTTVATSFLIPFELWKLATHPGHRGLVLAGVMLLNVIVVIYLALHLRRSRR